MPSPTDTLLRTQHSPVPTQTVLGLRGSMRTAPMLWLCLSKTGLKVVPPLLLFQTPPLAAPTYIVTRPFSTQPSRAAMRPLMAAGPMLRARRPDSASVSRTGAGAWASRAGTAARSRAVGSRAAMGTPVEGQDKVKAPAAQGARGPQVSGGARYHV